jgi:RNA polymerase sigma-70 factor (ECF subfamily)
MDNLAMVFSGELQELLERVTEAGAVAWPTWDGHRAAFKRRLLALVGENDNPIEMLRGLHAADLYLADACARGVSEAMAVFATRHLSRVDDHLKGFREIPVDEVRRELEDILLLGRGTVPPRVGQYAGRGPLDGFVAAAARNLARTFLRRTTRERTRELQSVDQPAVSDESAKRLIASRYEAVITEAVRAGLSSLDRRSRTIVRLHLSEGVRLTQIARMLNVHQSTVSRGLDAAVRHLHSEIRKRLREGHGLNDAEMESIIRDLRSQVSLSLSAALRDTSAGV